MSKEDKLRREFGKLNFEAGIELGKKQTKKEILEDYKGFVTEIWNSLEDDIEIDKKGEQGYKSSDECIKAIRKYTLPIIKKKSEALKSQIQTKEGKC